MRYLIFCLLASLAAVCWCDKPHHIHLSLGSDPSQMIVTWATVENVTNQRVVYNKMNPKGAELKAKATSKHFHDGVKMFIHRATMTGLTPRTRYQYHCASGNQVSPVFEFTTIDTSDSFLPRLAIFGDMDNNVKHNSVPQLTSDAKSHQVDAVFHIGDLAYFIWKKDGQMADHFMKMIEPVAGRVPYQVCPGNHESDHKNFSQYKNRFTMIGHDKSYTDNQYHSVLIGPFHLILYSSEYFYKDNFHKQWFSDEQRRRQLTWLETELKMAQKNRAQRPWVIVMAHRPMFCRNAECGPQMHKIEDLMHKYKVDLAFWGHLHVYERSWPIFKGKVQHKGNGTVFRDPTATINIITGLGGPPHKSEPDNGKKAWRAALNYDYGFTRVKLVNKYQLQLEQFSVEHKKVVDKITIIKTKH